MSKIAAIVPAYNEEAAIANVVLGIRQVARDHQLPIDVIVVNDGSSDKTAEIVSSLDCVMLDLPIRLGIGGAVQTGYKYAYHNGYDIALQVDGDGQHLPTEVPKLLDALIGYDVVIGSRFLGTTGYQSTPLRRVGIRFFQLIHKVMRLDITDSTSGFRALTRRALAVVIRDYPDDYPEPESVVIYLLNHLKMREISVVMRERQGGVSSIGPVASLFYLFKVTLAILCTFFRLRDKCPWKPIP